MKDSIAVLILFSILLVVLIILSAVFYSMEIIGSRLFLFSSINFGHLLTLLPNALLNVILPSVLISLFLACIKMQKKPGIRIISYLSLGALALAVLIFAPAVIRQNVNPQLVEMIQTEELQTGLRDLSFPGELISVDEGHFYFENQTGRTLSSLLIIKNTGPQPRITSIEKILYQHTEKGTIFLDRADNRNISLTPKKEETEPFQPKPSFQSIFNLFAPLQEHFDNLLWAEKEERFLLCLLLVTLVLSSSVFLRVSRWRIANIMLTLLVLFLVLTLYNFITFTLLPQARHVTNDLSLISLIPYSILIFFSGLFFLFDFILFPRKRSLSTNA